MMDGITQMFASSRVSFDRNDFLSPLQEEFVSFPKKAFSEEHIIRSDLEGILELHTKRRVERIPNDLPTIQQRKYEQRKSDTSILGKRKLDESDVSTTPNDSADEPAMKKIKLDNTSESGREIKRRAQKIIGTDPKKGCYLYMKAGIEFLRDAHKLELEGKTLQSSSYYRDNFKYFFNIIYFFNRHGCEKYISLSYLGAALSGIKNFFFQLQSLNQEGRDLYSTFSQMKMKCKEETSNVVVNDNIRKRMMTYICDMNNVVRIFQSIDEANKRIPPKYLPTPLQKDFKNVDSKSVIDYMTFLLDELEKIS